MSGFCLALVLGRCKAIEELHTRNGKLFIKATVSVSLRRKNADGVDEERTSLIPVTIFGKTAEVFQRFVKKGGIVHLAGRLDSTEWTTDSGDKRLSLSFVVEQLNLLPNDRAKSNSLPPDRLRRAERNQYGEPDESI